MKPNNRIGLRFGKLVIEKFSHKKPGNYWYVCKCDCGNTKTIEWGGLRRGAVSTCGCGRKDKSNVDMVGKRFERFVVIERTDDIVDGEFLLKCQCDCGTIFSAITSKIKRGRIQSCGCKRRFTMGYDENGAIKELTELDKLIRTKMVSYRCGAKRRGKKFNLSIYEFSNLVKLPCVYCGHIDTKLSYKTKNGYKINGIDRINSNKNYTLENSVPCCNQCNKSKLDYSVLEFKTWVKRVYETSRLDLL